VDDGPQKDARFTRPRADRARLDRRRTIGALVLLFLAVHVGIPTAGAIAFRRWGEGSLKAALAARTSDPWILDALGGLLARDGQHYLAIATEGYRTRESWAFFPLFPMTARALGPLLGGVPLAGLVVALLGSAACCLLLYAVAVPEGEAAAARAVALFLAFPTHFFFGAFYTEAPFFALVLLAMTAYARDRWPLAGAAGALAAATRSTGVLLAPALAAGALARRGWRGTDRRAAWLALVPLGTAAFFAAGYVATGRLDAPLAAQHAWARKATFPLLTIAQAAQDMRLDPADLQRDADVAATLLGFGLAARALRRVDAAQSVYMVLALLMPLSSGLVHSMARYVASIPALYLVLARDLAGPRRLWLVLAASLAAQTWLALRFCEGVGLV
jgi:hypothetical protein